MISWPRHLAQDQLTLACPQEVNVWFLGGQDEGRWRAWAHWFLPWVCLLGLCGLCAEAPAHLPGFTTLAGQAGPGSLGSVGLGVSPSWWAAASRGWGTRTEDASLVGSSAYSVAPGCASPSPQPGGDPWLPESTSEPGQCLSVDL